MLLQDILKKENNNLDIFRAIAAFMVIYGHAYAILPPNGHSDIVARMLGFDYSGSLAVKIFFFLSGLVVTNSLLNKKNVVQFLIARVFRIWPALLLVLTISTLVLGPLFTTKPLNEYFSNPSIYLYIYKNLLMHIQFNLPGVFESLPQKAVNGPLWTIPYEVFAYLVLATLFMVRLLDSRLITTFIFLLILVDPMVGNKLIFTWLPQNHEVSLLAPCFAIGSLLALWKEKVKIDASICIGAWILFFLFRTSAYNFYFFYLPLFLSILYISSQKFMIGLKPNFDISYGVYLWGWPVQQVMAYYFLNYSIRFNQVSSIFITAIIGFLSWHFVEKRCIGMGSMLGKRFCTNRLVAPE